MIRVINNFLCGIKRKDSQTQMIMKHLRTRGSITSMQAIKLYSITRLSGRIHELRSRGYDIVSIPIMCRNWYGKKVEFVKYVLNREICNEK